MNYIYYTIKGISRYLRAISKLNWIKLFRLYDKNAIQIVWIPISLKYFFHPDKAFWDLATISALIANEKRFGICWSLKIGKFFNKTIFFHPLSETYNIFDVVNYVDVYQHVIKQLEIQGNKVFSSSYEISFWENKVFMHDKFKQLGINEPKTIIIPVSDYRNPPPLNFPFLIKSEHACSSQGVFKINTQEDYDRLFSSTDFFKNNQFIIFQELLNMSKDLRVILVGEEIVLHYWRINKDSKEWKPTSTSGGSTVDFANFPEQWREDIIVTFKKLNLTTGAFDITWQNNDINTSPIYLEVSPCYQPNPSANLSDKNFEYGEYKKKLLFQESYDLKYVDIIFDIKSKQVNKILQNS